MVLRRAGLQFTLSLEGFTLSLEGPRRNGMEDVALALEESLAMIRCLFIRFISLKQNSLTPRSKTRGDS